MYNALKYSATIIFALFLCMMLNGQVLRCKYLYEYKTDAARGYKTDYSLCTESDGNIFLCYSENQVLRDSIGAVSADAGEDIASIQGKMSRYPRGQSWFIIGNPSDGHFHEYAIVQLTTHLDGEGEYPTPKWTLLEETEEICGHTCHMAVAEYLGRMWTIWFSKEISLNLGPWLLWGAPGMILKAEDKQGLFRFTCKEISVVRETRQQLILYLYNRFRPSGYPYFSYDIREMEQLLTRLQRYPEVFDEMSGSKTKVYTADGHLDTGHIVFPYIPLIPEEYWD